MKETDIIIVGNGPSAIVLSFFLSGYRPYYNGNPHPMPFLEEKLNKIKQRSIVECDLEELSAGLEGRSSNPVAILFDHLLHPDTDKGTVQPSLLTWQREEHLAIPHIVFGKNIPGGAWQQMDGNMHTISICSWMELPSMPFDEWLAKQKTGHALDCKGNRATVNNVRNYYCDFIAEKGLASNFYNNHMVMSVQKVFELRNGIDCESGEVVPCCKNVKKNHKFMWEVRGYKFSECSGKQTQREDFCFCARNVVLATGTTDIPKRLGVPGENRPTVVHSLFELKMMINTYWTHYRSEPLVIVGAGLSAADALLMAFEAKIPVVHVFRTGAYNSSLIFKKLPISVYPEYHRIYSLMKGKDDDDLYVPFPRHSIEEFRDEKVLIKPSKGDGSIVSIDSSLAAVLIGSRPNLSFLPYEGRNLGVVSNYSIDSKHNPMNVDPFSYQCAQEPGLFAMGPLVGDNFVRFAIGGALGITNYLWTKSQVNKM